jgi:CBS domain-containing protein
MTRRDDHYDAMLKYLGVAYYQTVRGLGTPADVARALDSVDAEYARRRGEPGPGPAGGVVRGLRTGLWRVHDVMTADAVTVDVLTPGRRIAWLLAEHHIHAVPVLSGGRRVAGVVSEEDLLRAQHGHERPGASLFGRHPAPKGSWTAERLMTSPAVTIHPDAPVAAAARRMTDTHLDLLPVVDGTGDLIGVVTRHDLLRIFFRPDADLAAEVCRVLTRVLLTDPATMTVSASDGVVTLTGQVSGEDVAQAAVRLAGDVDGVLAVDSKLVTPEAASRGGRPG